MACSWSDHDYHYNHGHLKLEYDEGQPFCCYGCLEMGFGFRYARVNQCGYLLHKDCENAKDTLTHPFFPGYVFHFLVAGKPNRRCDACGEYINGYVYHCLDKGWDLHPYCANLQHHMLVQAEEGSMTLVLHKEESSKCYSCGKKRMRKGARNWMYVSKHGEYHFHVSCVKKIMAEDLEEHILGGKRVEANESRALEKRLPKLRIVSKKIRKKTRKFAMLKKIVQIAIPFIEAVAIEIVADLIERLVYNK